MKRTNALPKPVEMSGCHPIDRTDARIRAYLDAVEPLPECASEEEFSRGLRLIERMASSSAEGNYPSLRLTRHDCADVLGFVNRVVPRNPKTFDTKYRDVPNPMMGLFMIMEHVIDELRR